MSMECCDVFLPSLLVAFELGKSSFWGLDCGVSGTSGTNHEKHWIVAREACSSPVSQHKCTAYLCLQVAVDCEKQAPTGGSLDQDHHHSDFSSPFSSPSSRATLYLTVVDFHPASDGCWRDFEMSRRSALAMNLCEVYDFNLPVDYPGLVHSLPFFVFLGRAAAGPLFPGTRLRHWPQARGTRRRQKLWTERKYQRYNWMFINLKRKCQS